jgi:hypothetical protein
VRTYHCTLASLKPQKSFWQQTAAAEGTPLFTLAADSNNESAGSRVPGVESKDGNGAEAAARWQVSIIREIPIFA